MSLPISWQISQFDGGGEIFRFASWPFHIFASLDSKFSVILWLIFSYWPPGEGGVICFRMTWFYAFQCSLSPPFFLCRRFDLGGTEKHSNPVSKVPRPSRGRHLEVQEVEWVEPEG